MKIIKQKITWLDFVSPTPQDLQYLSQNFHFHPITIDELSRPSTRSTVERFDDYIFLVLHLPIYDRTMKTSRAVEVDVLITKTHFITARYDDIQPIDEFFNRCQRDTQLRNRCMNETTGHLLYYFIEDMLSYSLRQLDHVVKKIEQTEDQIFKGHEREMIKEISLVKRDILDFRRIIKPYHSIFESLATKGTGYFGKSLRIFFMDIQGDYLRVWNAVENYKETIESLETTNSSLVQIKANEVMQALTLLAFIALPLTLIAQLLSVESVFYFLGSNHLLVLLVIMATIAAQMGLYSYFRKRKWL